jgi:hypothetical protein
MIIRRPLGRPRVPTSLLSGRRGWVVKIIVLAALAAGAVGFGLSVHRAADHAASVPPSTADGGPAATVKSWVAAVATGDYKTACRLMESTAQADLHQGSVGTCAQAVVSEARSMNGFVARSLIDAAIVKIRTAGASSTVRVADIVPAGDGGLGFLSQFSELRLAREASGWRITTLVASMPASGAVPV